MLGANLQGTVVAWWVLLKTWSACDAVMDMWINLVQKLCHRFCIFSRSSV